jgi:hypothetical protein
MEIMTKEQAFHTLDNHQYGIPFEAIEFLYNHPEDQEILSKIQTTFENVPNNYTAENAEQELDNNKELWYAIVAEKHLDIALLDSIINLVTQAVVGSHFLDEQVSVLMGLMGQKHGSIAVEKTLSAIENALEDKSKKDNPFLYLFDILFYADIKTHKEVIAKILKHPNNQYATPFAITICYTGFNTFIPQLKKFIQVKNKTSKDRLFEADFLLPDLKSIIKQLEAGKLKEPKDAVPYFEQRDEWKTYYQGHAAHFEEGVAEETTTVKNVKKVGRNEPCPCGSGKKYKKCCLKNK